MKKTLIPIVAIVTVTYNDKKNLQRTFKSIRENKMFFHRYYVIDGNSSDGSLELINESHDIIDGYFSEPDLGIYDAMNKVNRFNISDDTYILWLNAGDELLKWDISEIEKISNYDCAFFAVYIKSEPTRPGKLVVPRILKPYNEKNYMPTSVFRHQGFLIKNALFKQYPYNTSVGINADGLLMYKCILNDNYYTSTTPLSIFYLDGVSNSNFKKSLASYLKVYKEFNFNLFKLIFFQRKYFIRVPLKIILPFGVVKLVRKIKGL